MKIEFTKEQFEKLVDLVYIGDWVVNGITTERIEEYDKLREYIYSHCENFGIKNIVEYDEDIKTFCETREYEDGKVREYIDEFEDYVFWDELANRLAERDLSKELSTYNIKNKETRLKMLWDLEEKYNEEFENNGLENVRINLLNNAVIFNEAKIGRNELCPCGSGKKYKKCCLGKE